MPIVINHSNDVPLLAAVAQGGMQSYQDRRGDIAARRDQQQLAQAYANRRARAASNSRSMQNAFRNTRRPAAAPSQRTGVTQFRNQEYWSQDQGGGFVPTAANSRHPINQQQQAPVQTFRNTGGTGMGMLSTDEGQYGITSDTRPTDLNTGQTVRSNFAAPATLPQQQHPYAEYAQQRSVGLSPEKQQQVAAATRFAIETGLPANQFEGLLSEATAESRGSGLSQRDREQERIRQIRFKLDELEPALEAARARVTDAGLDPDMPPTQLADDFGRPVSEDAVNAYTQLKTLEQERRRATTAWDQLIRGGNQSQPDPYSNRPTNQPAPANDGWGSDVTVQ